MGPRLGRVEYVANMACGVLARSGFNGATLRTRGIRILTILRGSNNGYRFNGATLRTRGIRDRVFYDRGNHRASMGPRLGRVEYDEGSGRHRNQRRASMGPRLGRVEYQTSRHNTNQ